MQYVFHCGGAVSSAGVTAGAAMSAITVNLVVTAQTLQACWDEGVERTFRFSAAAPVIRRRITLSRKRKCGAGRRIPAYFGYAWMRRYMERICEFVAQKSPMKIALVRPTAVYGRTIISTRLRATSFPRSSAAP